MRNCSSIILVDIKNHPRQSVTGPDTPHHPSPPGVLPLHELLPEPGGRPEGTEGEVLDNLRSQLCLVTSLLYQTPSQGLKYFLPGFSLLRP